MANNNWMNNSNKVFTVLLLVLFFGCIAVFLWKAVLGDTESISTSLFTASGVGTAAGLYMKWNKQNNNPNND